MTQSNAWISPGLSLLHLQLFCCRQALQQTLTTATTPAARRCIRPRGQTPSSAGGMSWTMPSSYLNTLLKCASVSWQVRTFVCAFVHSLSHTHSLTHSLTRSLTHSLARSLARSPTHPPTNPSSHPHTQPSVYPTIHSCMSSSIVRHVLLSHAPKLCVLREGVETLCAELLTIPCILEVAWRRMLLSQSCLVGFEAYGLLCLPCLVKGGLS